MKFTTIVFAGLATLSQVNAAPQVEDVLDKVDTFIDNVQTKWSDGESFINDIKTNVEGFASTAEPLGALTSAYASATAKWGAEISSLSSVAATATGEELARITAAMADVSSAVEKAKSEGSSVVDEVKTRVKDDDSAGAVAGVQVVLAGVLGGAAVLAVL